MIPKDLIPIIGDYVFPSTDDFCKSLPDDVAKYKAACQIIQSMSNDMLIHELVSFANNREYDLGQKEHEKSFKQYAEPYDVNNILCLFKKVKFDITSGNEYRDYGSILSISSTDGFYIDIVISKNEKIENVQLWTSSCLYSYVRDRHTFGRLDLCLFPHQDIQFYRKLIQQIWNMCDLVIKNKT